MSNRYTHGHDPSVLANHRWRTAANSAAYLLPHLTRTTSRSSTSGAVRAPSPRISRAVAAPGSGRGHRQQRGGRFGGPPMPRRAPAWSTSRSTCGDVFDAALSTTTASTSSTPIRCFNTSPTRSVRYARCDGYAARGGLVAARDADYAAMVWAPADPRLDRWRADLPCVGPGATPRSRMPRGTSWAGRSAAGLLRRRRVGRRVVLRHAAEDRAWWGSTWADRDQYLDARRAGRRRRGWPTRLSSTTSPTAGERGQHTRMDGSVVHPRPGTLLAP